MIHIAHMAKKSYNDSEQQVVTETTNQFLFAKRYLDQIHLRMNQQEELYRTYIDPQQYPHGARVFDPRIFRVIETIVPRMVANEPTGSFYPTEGGDMMTSQILDSLIKYDWQKAEMFPKLVLAVKSMLIFGTFFGRTHWDYRTRQRTQMVPKKVNGRTMWTPKNTEKIEVTEFDGPNFEPLNIYDCFPDPNSTSLTNMRWFIYRTFKTFDELERQNERHGIEYYKNLDKLKEAMNVSQNQPKTGDAYGSGNRPPYMQFREHRRIMLSTQDLHGQDASNPEVVIARRFTREGWCDIAPEYGIVIREEENPYFHGDLPLIYGVDYPYPGELYGMGEIEPIDRIQRAINAVLNQRLDNVQLILRNMWKVKKNSGVDMHTLVSAPGNVITTDDMAAVEPVTIPDATGSTFVQTMTYLTSSLQNGSGIMDYTNVTGQNTNTLANGTATGSRLVHQEGNQQFKLKIQLFNHMVIQRIANQWKDLRIQYTTEKQMLRIMGKDAVAKLRDTTKLSQVTPDGEQIAPGELDKQAKLDIQGDGSFAFLHLFPDDIQPAIVGNYDFVAVVSTEQLLDPFVVQENLFAALDKIQNPDWSRMLFRNGKMLNVISLTQKIFDKLNIGIEGKDVLMDFPKGQAYNFDMPKVTIRFEDLPPDGKVQAAAMAGLNLDPNSPQLQQMGVVRTTVNVGDTSPEEPQVLQTEGLINQQPQTQPGQPLTPQQIDQMKINKMKNPLVNPIVQQQQQQQQMQQAAMQQAMNGGANGQNNTGTGTSR